VDPVGQKPPHLADFLEHEGSLLSPRATKGFLERTYVAKLRFAPGFIEAVQAHLRFVGGASQTDDKLVA
jgi:DNA (cytosine-5)-methyltransferase 1